MTVRGPLVRRLAALMATCIVLGLFGSPPVRADPQCWDRYSQRNYSECGGNGPFTVGPNQGDSEDGGLLHQLSKLPVVGGLFR